MPEIEGRRQATVTEGDTVTLHCGASVHNFTDRVQWFKKKTYNASRDDDEKLIQNNSSK